MERKAAEPNAINDAHNVKPDLADASFFHQQVGELIGRARKRAGLTQIDLAEKLGVTRTTVGNIETGSQTISFHQIFRICAIINAQVSDVVPPYLKEFLPVAITPVEAEGLRRLLKAEANASGTPKGERAVGEVTIETKK